MKRIMSVCVALAMAVTLFAGCSSKAAVTPAGYGEPKDNASGESGGRTDEARTDGTAGTSQTGAASETVTAMSGSAAAPVVRTGVFQTNPNNDGAFAFQDISYRPSANDEFSEDSRIALLLSGNTAAAGRW